MRLSGLDLALVNPGSREQSYGPLGELAAIEPPLWAALAAAVVRQHGFSVAIVDAEAENLSPEAAAQRVAQMKPRLAGIMVLGANPSASSTPRMTAAGETAAAIRRHAPDCHIAFGGLHPSALPRQTLRQETADYVCQGEGFGTFPLLLQSLAAANGVEEVPGLWFRRNGGVTAGPSPTLAEPDTLPTAAWDLLPMDRYRAHNWHCFDDLRRRQPYAVVYTSLGCPFSCSYCNIHALYDGRPGIRFRSPQKVIEEIDLLVEEYGVRNIKFFDELFALKADRVMELCDLLAGRGHDLNIWAYARVDTVSDPMLRQMRRAGINWLAYGVESASLRVRQGVTKRFGQDAVARAARMTREAGISVIGNFIFGLPDDDLETMQETLDLARELNFEYVNFYVAMAYPGSALYDEARRQGTTLPKAWHGYGQYSQDALPLPTKHLPAGEVLRFRDRAFQQYFNGPRYLEMVRERFGEGAVEHIGAMLERSLPRKHAC